MNCDSTRLLALVGLIYDAVLKPDLWNEVMERAAGFVGGAAASIFRQDAIRRIGNVYYNWGTSSYYERLYFDKYIQINPLLPVMLTVEVGRVCSSSELLAPAELFETRFYKEWVKPQGLIDNVFCNLERSATSMAG